jgi:hypothetical protein
VTIAELKRMDKFLYESGRHPGMYINIGQRDDLSFCLIGATFMTDDENRFNSISDIEEYIEDDLTLVIEKTGDDTDS